MPMASNTTLDCLSYLFSRATSWCARSLWLERTSRQEGPAWLAALRLRHFWVDGRAAQRCRLSLAERGAFRGSNARTILCHEPDARIFLRPAVISSTLAS